jgi:hypothetical protein
VFQIFFTSFCEKEKKERRSKHFNLINYFHTHIYTSKQEPDWDKLLLMANLPNLYVKISAPHRISQYEYPFEDVSVQNSEKESKRDRDRDGERTS